MEIQFRKLTNTHHVLAVVRDDGTRDEMHCETRSVMDHDLIHLAVEAQSAMSGGFWGSLAAGVTFAALNDRDGAMLGEGQRKTLGLAETIVGVMTGLGKSSSPADDLPQVLSYLEQVGVVPPSWLNLAFVDAVEERLRKLRGHWKATPFGKTMIVHWPADE